MIAPEPAPAVRPRAASASRPATDPGCAGCSLMGLFRALRRAGLPAQGGPGCDPGAARTFRPEPGRWAAVAGSRDAAAALPRALRAGARVLVVADRARSAAAVEASREALRRAGIAPVDLDPGDLAAAEAAVAAAAEGPAGAPRAFLALARCVRGAPRSGPAVEIDPGRCNGCGACIVLGCPAVSDGGGEAMAVDPASCSGCGICAPLCRPGAIVPRR